MADALNRVFEILRLHPQIFYRLEVASSWGIRFTQPNHAALHLVERGRAWLRMSEQAAPILLEAGDVVIVSNIAQYTLSDDSQTAPIPLRAFLDQHHNEAGSTTTLLCGEFRPVSDAAYPIFGLLPPLIQVKNQNGHAEEWLTNPVNLIISESQSRYPGYETVISRLMDILFIMVMRYWIAHHTADEGGWLRALYDPQIGRVLEAIHQHPEQAWDLQTLAGVAHLSRSTFAARFTQLVGEAPVKYLTRWRIQIAMALLLDDPALTIEMVAHRVGYGSAYAFTKAFKRLIGVAPSVLRSSAKMDGAANPLRISD